MEPLPLVDVQNGPDGHEIEVQDDEDDLPFEGPVSPIKAIRDSIPVGLRVLAKQLHCSYGMIYLAERGCYQSIPPILRSWINTVRDKEGPILRDGLSLQMIDELYLLYIRETRDLFGEQYKLVLLDVPTVEKNRLPVGFGCGFPEDGPIPERPLVPPINALIRYTNLSKTAFYKGLCVQPANIYKLQTASCRSLPGQVIQALHDAHTPYQVISYLDVLTKDFYSKTKARTNGHG